MKKNARYTGIIALMSILASAPAMGFNFQGFGDITAGDSQEPGQTPGFSLGQLDLWNTRVLDDENKTRSFVEIVIESVDGSFIVDLERLWIEYDITSALSIRGGRFHSALGYWNRAYHHGSYVQTSIDRPWFMDFEDGDHAILPTHIVGMMIKAASRSPAGKLSLDLQVGNGTFYNGSEMDPGNDGDIDRDKAVMARLFFTPGASPNLGLGVNFSFNTIRALNAGSGFDKLATQTIWALDLSYMGDAWEMMGEYYRISNTDSAAIRRISSAWYLQAGYRLSDNLMPYGRYEDMQRIDLQDPYFITLNAHEYRRAIIGARYELSETTAVKLEAHSIGKADKRYAGYWAQWTFAF